MKKRCINPNSIQVKELSEELGLKPIIVAAKIAVWQDKNNTYDFPSANDLVGGINYSIKAINFQLPSEEGKIVSEKTIRDLAARLADRIGIEVKFISDRSQNFKGKLEGNIATINLAYATLDTIFHEVSGHAIIATLKQKSETSVKNHIQDLIEKGVIIKEC